MNWLNSALSLVLCLSFSASILNSEVNDSLQLPEEIKNLTNDQIFVPSTPIIPIYPLRAKKDGVNADVWVKYKILQGKIDSTKVIFCSKDGYNLESSAIMSIKEYDFSKDSTAANLDNKWIYTKVIFGWGWRPDKSGIRKLPEFNSDSSYGGANNSEFVPLEVMPEFIHKEIPEYQSMAMRAGIKVSTYVRVLVKKDGSVGDVKIEKSSGVSSLDDAVIKAAFKCTFKPGIQKGKPVNCWVSFPYEFTLNR